MTASDDMTLAQHLHDVKLALCSAYPGLDPIRLLDYPMVDVIDLIRQHLERNRRTQPLPDVQNRPQPAAATQEKIIYRQADDSWY